MIDWLFDDLYFWKKQRFKYLRGARLIDQGDAARILARTVESFPDLPFYRGLNLAGVRAGLELLRQGVEAVGCPGSGKSVSIYMMLCVLLPLIGWVRGMRAMIYDAKGEGAHYVRHLLPAHTPCHDLNPFSPGGVAWDVAGDIRTPADARQLGAMLVPQVPENHQPFFTDDARDKVVGVTQLFQRKAPGRWDLRDIDNITATMERLRWALSQDPTTRHLTEHLNKSDASMNSFSTLRTHLSKLTTVSAGFHNRRKISIREFLDTESVLLLPHDEAASEALAQINRLLVRRFSDLVLSRNDNTQFNLLAIDEYRAFRNCDLSAFASKSRSAGGALLVAYQDLVGAEEAHGKFVQELGGLLKVKMYFRVVGRRTAEYGAAALGNQDVVVTNTSEGPNGATTSEHIMNRPVVLPEEIMGLPLASRDKGVKCYVATPFGNVFLAHYPMSDEYLALPPAPANPPRRPAATQTLKPFTDEDARRLGLKELPINRSKS